MKHTRTWLRMYYTIAEILKYDMWSEDTNSFVQTLLTLRRLAFKHHRLAEMACNGEGVIRGQRYYSGAIDDYARREYGSSVKSAYIKDGDILGVAGDTDETIFDLESEKVEAKIKALAQKIDLRVEFQGDPRGYTVKFYKGDRFIDIQDN